MRILGVQADLLRRLDFKNSDDCSQGSHEPDKQSTSPAE